MNSRRNTDLPGGSAEIHRKQRSILNENVYIGVLAGDGIGPEVTEEGLKVLRAVMAEEGFACNFVEYPYSGAYYLKTKETTALPNIDKW